MTPSELQAAAAEFEARGFWIARGLLCAEEAALLQRIARRDRELATQAYGRADGEGRSARLVVVNTLPRDTIYAALARSEKLVRPVERFLGGEVYHYHHKMILKEARSGGAWNWHQDYGYWYENGCLFPWMASCMIAVDRGARQNGCLQALEGSQRMGRIDHVRQGNQTSADPERVERIEQRCPRVYCELEPGDALFFHCNLLHRSDRNDSGEPRRALICCYNSARNDPYKKHHHPNYSPLDVWPHERVMQVGEAQWRRLNAAGTAAQG